MENTEGKLHILETIKIPKHETRPGEFPIENMGTVISSEGVLTCAISWETQPGSTSTFEMQVDENLSAEARERWFYEKFIPILFDQYLALEISSISNKGPMPSHVQCALPPKQWMPVGWVLLLKDSSSSTYLKMPVSPAIQRTLLEYSKQFVPGVPGSLEENLKNIPLAELIGCLNAIILKIEATLIEQLSQDSIEGQTNPHVSSMGVEAPMPDQLKAGIVDSLVEIERLVENAFQLGELEDVDRKQIFSHFTAIRDLLSAPAPNLSAIAFIIKSLDTAYGKTIAFGTLIIVLDQALRALGLPSAQEIMDMFPDELFEDARPISPPPSIPDPTTKV